MVKAIPIVDLCGVTGIWQPTAAERGAAGNLCARLRQVPAAPDGAPLRVRLHRAETLLREIRRGLWENRLPPPPATPGTAGLWHILAGASELLIPLAQAAAQADDLAAEPADVEARLLAEDPGLPATLEHLDSVLPRLAAALDSAAES